MPIYNIHCAKGCAERKLFTPEQYKDFFTSDRTCATHGLSWSRAAHGPATSAVETIDNGLMVKKVETYVGISEMVAERARLDDPKIQRGDYAEDSNQESGS